MTIGAAHLGMFGSHTAEARQRVSRELTAIGRAEEWINSSRLIPSSLAGKVVLVDFWTYTCINWLRTLPYVRAWAQKYREGLTVIGVHTPEFAFEQDLDNVRRAVREMRVEYPVVIDNDYAIWRAFRNQYWPALYFIDRGGRIRERHFGEGEYERSERNIQRLLADAGIAAPRDGVVSVGGDGLEAAADWDNLRSPETYVGYDRMQNFSSRGGADPDRRRDYSAPGRLALNEWALAGQWTIGRQATVLSGPAGRIVHRFHARDLHLVLGPSRRESEILFRVSIDGRPPGPAHGFDVDESGNGRVVEQRLCQLIRQARPIVDRTFEIEFIDAGVEAFAFTFG